MKKIIFIILLLIFLPFGAHCMEGSFPLTKDPVESVLQKLVVPASLRWIDFSKAKANYKNIIFSCKYLKNVCESMEIKDEKGNNILFVTYLQDLDKKARQENQLQYIKDMRLGIEISYFPDEQHQYPKLTLCLINSHRSHAKTLIVEMLENLCNVNKRDTIGRTPLYYAIKSCDIDMIQRLIECGADLRNIDDKGNSALQVAESIDPVLIRGRKPLIDSGIAEDKEKKIKFLTEHFSENFYVIHEKKEKADTRLCSIQ